ncbi:MAG: hypothetical protein HYW70_00485, partial [Candidatus Nealsonbacteria bacterium]|nr:hypothetical protein [Candidatus Nealsonbacteria bacterium]
MEIAASTTNGYFAVSGYPGGDGDKFVINGSGNVGIASTTPSTALSVQGNIWGSGDVRFFGTSATTTISGGLIVGTNTLWAPAGGNIGIGTAVPTYTLDVSGTGRYATSLNVAGTATTTGTSLAFAGLGTVSSTDNLLLMSNRNLSVTSTNNILFGTGIAGAERMRIDSSGNVGIGTLAPDNLLDISKANGGALAADVFLTITQASTTAAADPYLVFEIGEDAATRGWRLGIDDSDSDSFKIGTGAFSSNDILTLDTSGRLGLATSTPVSLLSVHASTTDFAMTLRQANEATSGGLLHIYKPGTDILTILNNGNVGIASSTPGAVLSVGGDVLIGSGSTIYAKNLRPVADNAGSLGSSSLRYQSVELDTVTGLRLWNSAGDANALAQLTGTSLNFGAGGGTALDTNLYRSSANVLKTDDGFIAFASSTIVGDFSAGASGVPTLFVDDGGNVGIASSTPSATLSIQGNVISSGNFTFYGSGTNTFSGQI